MALQFEARKVALKQDRTGFVLTLSLHPDEIPSELLRDFVGARYACALVRIQDDESATAYNNRVKTAGMLCRDPLFQQFMSEKYRLDLVDENETATMLCDKCGIESRSQLNGDSVAQSIFDEIVTIFEQWKHEKNDSF
jgi:hypothetical protein